MPDHLPTGVLFMALAGVLGTLFFVAFTSRPKVAPDPAAEVRRSLLQLFRLAAQKDYAGAATLLAYSGPDSARVDDVLRFSHPQDAPEVVARCGELSDLTARGGTVIEEVTPRGEEMVCLVAVRGAAGVRRQARLRRVKERWALVTLEDLP